MRDVAIIGGGPAGSTVGTYIKLYNADIDVVILEREEFPRDHVGESLLPTVCRLLSEMRVWDKVEGAGFPVKVGATYRWGADTKLWDFEFVPGAIVKDVDRPSPFSGVRAHTALQVDRSLYDKILLDHAAALGCDVREETRVKTVEKDGDRVTGLILDDGSKVEARYYVDATGASGLLRRAMGVEVEAPTTLRNIAMWDYWQNAKWAVEIGVDGTRVMILSLGYGWLWFIPLGPTRTSVGFVCPSDYYKSTGMKPEELYKKAISEEPFINRLMTEATSENKFQTTNDWSYIADRLVGENWFLTGDSCGFADPILSAGLTLAQGSAKHVAHVILSLEDGECDPLWLKSTYNETGRGRIRQHVKFADFWYSANGCFSDLREMTREIAEQAGISLDAEQAFRWLATGGFALDDPSSPILGGYSLPAIKVINDKFCQSDSDWNINLYNRIELNLEGAVEDETPVLYDGLIWPKPCFKRDNRVLPQYGFFAIATKVLMKYQYVDEIMDRLRSFFTANPITQTPELGVHTTMSTIEAMLTEGWAKGSVDPAHPMTKFVTPDRSATVHDNKDIVLAGVNID